MNINIIIVAFKMVQDFVDTVVCHCKICGGLNCVSLVLEYVLRSGSVWFAVSTCSRIY